MLRIPTEFRIGYKKIISYMFGIFSFVCCFDNAFLSYKIPFYSKGLFLLRLLTICAYAVYMIIKMHRPSKVTIMMLLMYMIIIFSTFLHGGDITSFGVIISSSLVIVLTLDIASRNESILDDVMNSWKIIICILIAIDIATEMLYPGGLYHDRLYSINWFLGYKTARMTYIIPLLFISIYQSYKKEQRFRKSIFVIMAVSIVDVAFSQASGATISLIAIFVLSIVILNLYRRKLRHVRRFLAFILDHRIFITTYIAITFIVVIVNYTLLMSKVADIIGKDMTFTGRTFIWKACMEQIISSPILGKGYWTALQYESITMKLGVYGGTNAHNAILTILMDGGMLALAVYLMIYLLSMRSTKERSQFDMLAVTIIYVTWILGVSSSAFVFSPYVFMMYWLFQYKKDRKFSIFELLNCLLFRKETL